MKLKSFSTVAIRIIGLMTIVYGILAMLYIVISFLFLFKDLGPEASYAGLGSMLLLQFLLPMLMVLVGIILIAASRALSNSICSGLEE
ncbi:MAG TPA: hypothetical protein VF791_06240 [Pyrinomonadaceae bacterium]